MSDVIIPKGHSTKNEIDFLKNLGYHRRDGRTEVKRIDLLRQYRKSMANRVYWGGLDKKAIAWAVDEMIHQLEVRTQTVQ